MGENINYWKQAFHFKCFNNLFWEEIRFLNRNTKILVKELNENWSHYKKQISCALEILSAGASRVKLSVKLLKEEKQKPFKLLGK